MCAHACMRACALMCDMRPNCVNSKQNIYYICLYLLLCCGQFCSVKINTTKPRGQNNADNTYVYIALAFPVANCSLDHLGNCLEDIFHYMTQSR